MTAEPAAEQIGLQVAVERTGGFAGLTRRWSVSAPPEQPGRWLVLVEECPWDEASSPTAPVGADRFCWTVTAIQGGERRHAELAEPDVEGAWRALIDAVRAADEAPASDAPSAPEQ